MKEDTIRGLLKQWCEEYGIDPDKVRWCGYKDLGGTTMGICQSYAGGWCNIWLDDKWKNRPLGWLEESVLWHEMAHAIAYLEDMKGNGHDDRWKEIRDSKIKYRIGDWFAKLLFPIL